jgi:hypothetical protein
MEGDRPCHGRWRSDRRRGRGKRRTTRLAVGVRVTGEPKKAELHTVVTCSKMGLLGPGIFSRRDMFRVRAPAMRVLRLPIAYPENCAVTAVGISKMFSRRWRITIEILAQCTAQTFPAAKGKCI